jgi:hypothetical protein
VNGNGGLSADGRWTHEGPIGSGYREICCERIISLDVGWTLGILR